MEARATLGLHLTHYQAECRSRYGGTRAYGNESIDACGRPVGRRSRRLRQKWGVAEPRDERRSQTRPAARVIVRPRPRVAAGVQGLRPHGDREVERSVAVADGEEGSRAQGSE